MKLWFANRAYPDWLIIREMCKIKHKPNDKSISSRSKKFLFYYLFFGQIIRKHTQRKHFYTGLRPRRVLKKKVFRKYATDVQENTHVEL